MAAALGGVDGRGAGGVLLAAVGAVLEQDAAGFAEAGRRRQVERGGPVGGGGVDLDAALEDRGGALRPVVVRVQLDGDGDGDDAAGGRGDGGADRGVSSRCAATPRRCI